jgi:thymidine kinase
VFKPEIDDRYSRHEIVSHSEWRLMAEIVRDPDDISRLVADQTQVVGIDEAHFFGPRLAGVVEQLARAGKRVIVAGLDTDYLGRPFPPMPELLCVAESITKLLAICVQCGHPAHHTQRIAGVADLIVVGAAGLYEARCRACFRPRLGRQEHGDSGNGGRARGAASGT